jgi:hypothetical protein
MLMIIANINCKIECTALDGLFPTIGTPRPGFEPGSKAPEASRMSTTLPRHLVNHVHGDSRFHTNNTVKGIKALEQSKNMAGRIRIVFFCEMIATGQRSIVPC